MSYDWVFLDADGTLFDYHAAEAAAIEGAFDACGLTFGAAIGGLYTRINAAVWREYERGEISQEALKAERFRRLFTAIGVTADAEVFSERYLRILSCQARLLDGAELVVRQLERRARLLLLTNGIAEVQRPRVAAAPIRDCFADVVISGEVGAAKPDPAIFDHALERAGQPAREAVLMVGDNLVSDIAGGAGAGLDTCWYNPAGERNGHGVEPSYEIRALSELLAIV
ncbi:MAG: YjjG family noncanonical pyrimidine nucleotidase [Holophagae bacterium]